MSSNMLYIQFSRLKKIFAAFRMSLWKQNWLLTNISVNYTLFEQNLLSKVVANAPVIWLIKHEIRFQDFKLEQLEVN